MTPERERQTYINLGNPVPGDYVTFSWQVTLYSSPPTAYSKKFAVAKLSSNVSTGIVLAIDEKLRDLLVLAHVDGRGTLKIGWCQRREVYAWH